MIESTFQHVKNIRLKGELRLWQSNITSWDKLLEYKGVHPHFTKKMWNELRTDCLECKKALDEKNFPFFIEHFPEDLHWRLFPYFINKIAYIDVEMTGTDIDKDFITCIALYDGQMMKTYVKNINLHEFPIDIQKYAAIATFDGQRADLPFIKKEFGLELNQLHFDLYAISRKSNIRGGLKVLEKYFNLTRQETSDVSGETAIFLWEQFQSTKDKRYLDTLISYNLEDTLVLEPLLFLLCEELRKKEGIPFKKLESPPILKKSVVKADLEILEEIRKKYYR